MCKDCSCFPFCFGSLQATWRHRSHLYDVLAEMNDILVCLLFSLQENSFLDVESKAVCGFEKDMKLEAIDPKHPSFICVCTIVRVKGTRLRLHFDGWSESYDFWTSADSPFLFHIGWCEKNGQKLHPPRSKRKTRTCSFWSLLCSKIQD